MAVKANALNTLNRLSLCNGLWPALMLVWMRTCILGVLFACGLTALSAMTVKAATLNISYGCSSNVFDNLSYPGDTLIITLTAACKTQNTNYGNNVTLNSIVSSSGISKTIAVNTQYAVGDVFTYTVGPTLGASTHAAFSSLNGVNYYGVYARTPNVPTVTSISPTSGTTNGGTSITITGSQFKDFGQNSVLTTVVTGVTIGGVAAQSYIVSSQTSITAVTPAGTAGTASVVVTNTVGSNAANSLFTYVIPPTATNNGVAAQNLTVSGAMTGITPLTGSGGNGSLTYYISAGTLPSGITLNASTGVISGTPTGTYSNNVVVAVRDSLNLSASTTATVSFTVLARPTGSPDSTSRNLTVGTATSFTPITGSGGTAPLTYFISSGTLPAGLTLNSSTGQVSGTPSAASSTTSVTFGVKDANNVAPQFGATSSVNISVAKGAQTVSFTSSAPFRGSVGGNTYTPTASATSGLAVTFTISVGSAAVCTISSGVVSFIGSGTCTIHANQAGNVNYNAATQVLQGVSVVSRPTATAVTTSQTLTAGTAMSSFTPLTGSGGYTPLNYFISSGTLPSGLALNASTGAVTGTPNARFTTSNIVFSVQDANNAVAATTSTVTFTVNLVTPVLSGFSLSASNIVYGSSAPTITPPTSASSGAISYSSSNASVATISGSTITINGVGTTTITANQAASGIYDTASATASLTVTASSVATLASLSLSSGTLSPAFTSGTTSYTASVPYATSGITVTPTVTDSNATARVNGTMVSSGSASGTIPLAIGSNTITTAVTAQDGVTVQTYTTTVTRAATVPDAPTMGTATAGNAQASVTFTAPVFNGGAVITGFAMTCASSDGGVTGTVTGSASPITVTGLTNGKTYTCTATATNSLGTGAASSASNPVTPKAPQSITAIASASTVYTSVGTSTISVSGGSGSGPDSYAVTSGSCSIDSSTGVLTAGPTAQTCTVTATKAADSTYTLATATVSVTVVLPTPVLTFATPGTASVSMVASLTNAATSSLSGGSYGAISYASSNSTVANVNPSTGAVTPMGAGTATITATQAASAGYNAQASQTYTLTVNLASQSITAALSPVNLNVGDTGTITVSGGNGSGALTYSSSNMAIATVSASGHVNGIAPGSVTITVYKAADSTYAAASTTMTLTVSLIQGSCGSSMGLSFSSLPTQNLCSAGVASAVQSGAGQYSWTCTGNTGAASCNASWVNLPDGSTKGSVVVLPSSNQWILNSSSAQFVPVQGAVNSPQSPPPPGIQFPVGMLRFEMVNGVPGSVAAATIYFSAPIPVGAGYMKYGKSPDGFGCSGTACSQDHWYFLPSSQVQFAPDRMSVTLSIQDGGVGDDDLTADGVISDPGGPALMTLSESVTAIPTLSEWAMLLLVGLMVWIALCFCMPKGVRTEK